MSCYNCEWGTFKLPVSEYHKFKKSFLNEMKKFYQRAYDDALELHKKIISASKVTKFQGKEKNWIFIYNQNRYSGTYNPKDLDPFDLAFSSMFRKKDENGLPKTDKPLKPRKSDFTIKTKVKNPYFNFDDASISFNDKEHTISWDVSENNRACERARENPVAQTFFAMLKKVKRTRNTGGCICGNDEYNRDSDYVGGGGNYEKEHYGLKRA